jgi:hypothetical protein
MSISLLRAGSRSNIGLEVRIDFVAPNLQAPRSSLVQLQLSIHTTTEGKTCRRDKCALTQLSRPASPRLHKHLFPPRGRCEVPTVQPPPFLRHATYFCALLRKTADAI